MEAITYYLQANLAFAVLYGAYLAALRHETWFNARRAWLLLAPIAALVLPLLSWPGADEATLTFQLPLVTATSATGVDASISWTDRLVLGHVLVSAALLLILLVRIIIAWRATRTISKQALSFLARVQLPTGLPADDRSTIEAHEHVHVKQKHSLDVIAYETLVALCWSNPIWRFAARELRLVHEHIADRTAQGSHTDYASLLLAHALRVPRRTLQHTFSNSNLKQRMTMLLNTRSPRLARPKLLLAIPALFVALTLVSWRFAAAPVQADASVFAGVDQQPEFPGGTEALIKYLTANIRYPKQAVAEKVEGRVFMSFTVKANGEVRDVKVKKGVRADLDAEALRVVSGMPAWKPALSSGKPVDAEMTLPIAFAMPK